MDPTLTWLVLIAAAVLIVLGAVRFDMFAARWRELFIGTPRPDQPPPPKMAEHDPLGES
ncbi:MULTISPECIES: hypothetical protein [Roseateles]|uniref:Uncharacterized protein n=1 Tax=Pelomonas aquatica TaxID=431058 RepID=A0ABU1ZDV0_9BURK|nr:MULTISPECIES: hypothetical protein [Roseateles]MDR7298797.1 hypothetical protein [Pelomonas aquatica]